MASTVLFAPTVESYAAPVVGENGKCRIYFRVSDYVSADEWDAYSGEGRSKETHSLHAVVNDQETGLSVINRNVDGCYSGIILNLDTFKVTGEEKMYYTDIDSKYIVNGWTSGKIYKVQIRLSKVSFIPDSNKKENKVDTDWLNANASKFSEWSTVTITKATSEPHLLISELNYNSKDKDSIKKQAILHTDVLELNCNYLNDDISESLYSYQFLLYNEVTGILMEDSNVQVINKYERTSHFHYKFKHEINAAANYYVVVNIVTINYCEKSFKVRFITSPRRIEDVDIRLKYVENDQDGSIFQEEWYGEEIQFKDTVQTYLELEHYDTSTLLTGDIIKVLYDETHRGLTTYYTWTGVTFRYMEESHKHVAKYITSKDMEQEEGVICLKIYDPAVDDPQLWNGVLILRRTDEDSLFRVWEDIQYIKLEQQFINSLPLFYDNTIESGKSYMYALQYQDIHKNKTGNLVTSVTKVLKRDLEYTYLAGEGGEYLPLKFNTTINNYQLVRQDSITPTLGSRYPFITRVAAPKYKQFEMSGTISFHMDDCEQFLKSGTIYGYSYYETGEPHTNIPVLDANGEQIEVTNYKGHSIKQYEEIPFMDYYLEKKFREAVIEFLTNGKPKLFKSSSEPNMIVMVTNSSFTPNQTLGRLIYDFSCTCTEIDEANLTNYIKYGIIQYNNVNLSKIRTEAHVGQIIGSCRNGTNLMEIIKKKYDGTGKDNGGYEMILENVSHLDFNFYSKPGFTTAINQGNVQKLYPGWVLNFNGNNRIIVDSRTHRYITDERLMFTPDDPITVYSDNENSSESVLEPIEYEINFIYYTHKKPFINKEEINRQEKVMIGQYNGLIAPNTNLYRILFGQNFWDGKTEFIKLSHIDTVKIEAIPGSVFEITDSSNGVKMKNTHIVPPTGYLNINDDKIGKITNLVYVGMMEKQGDDYVINRNQSTQALLDYIYTIYRGEYS